MPQANVAGGRMVNGLDDPDCAVRLRGKLSNAIASMMRLGINHSDVARMQWQGVAQKYRDRWAQGDVDAILPVLSDLLIWVRQSNIDLSRNSDVIALFNDPGFRTLRNRIPALTRDPKMFDMFRRRAGAGSID
ncbi:MAG: hypothetical protein ACM4D3_19700 [Candidatus Sericytochromatia bacterium]